MEGYLSEPPLYVAMYMYDYEFLTIVAVKYSGD